MKAVCLMRHTGTRPLSLDTTLGTTRGRDGTFHRVARMVARFCRECFLYGRSTTHASRRASRVCGCGGCGGLR